MNHLTHLEREALSNIYKSGYGDGETPTVWDWCATGGNVTQSVVGGVVSSLRKKGFVKCDGRGRDATITVTTQGASAFKG